MCIPANYSSLTIPPSPKLFDVRVKIEIQELVDVNEHDFTVTMSVVLRFDWEEERLFWLDGMKNLSEPWLPLNLEMMQSIWIPDIYIYNLKYIQKKHFTSDFAGIVALQ